MKYDIHIVTATKPDGTVSTDGGFTRAIDAADLTAQQLKVWIDGALKDTGLVSFKVDRRD